MELNTKINKIFDYDEAFSRNIGWLTEEEQKILSKKCIAIPGMGGAGGNHVITLARLGIQNFKIADFDHFELANFNRQAGATIEGLGKNKAEFMAQCVAGVNPDAEITTYEEGVTEGNIDDFLSGVDIVLDSLDFFTIDLRELLYQKCKSLNIPVVLNVPVGMGASQLCFHPNKMSFEEYFGFNGLSYVDKILNFAVGTTPKGLQSSYMVKPEAVKIDERKVPSTGICCQIGAGMAATAILKVLLKRGEVAWVPRSYHFDAYSSSLKKSWVPFGAKNILFKWRVNKFKRR